MGITLTLQGLGRATMRTLVRWFGELVLAISFLPEKIYCNWTAGRAEAFGFAGCLVTEWLFAPSTDTPPEHLFNNSLIDHRPSAHYIIESVEAPASPATSTYQRRSTKQMSLDAYQQRVHPLTPQSFYTTVYLHHKINETKMNSDTVVERLRTFRFLNFVKFLSVANCTDVSGLWCKSTENLWCRRICGVTVV